jgi:hypothetical protein
VNEEEATETKADEPPRAEDVPRDNPPSKKEVQGKPAQKVRHKKINSRKKVGKQACTIIVTVPTKSEEIKDVGATAKRRRGRPKKTPGTNPSDPRKGSVLDPGKGVCADPRGGDTTLGAGGPGPPMGHYGTNAELY